MNVLDQYKLDGKLAVVTGGAGLLGIKHGVIGLTRYVSTYWAKNGVRCNALAPGGVYNGHSDEFVSKISNLIPMGRMAKVDEYKATVVYMCSDASSYMNGSVISIDGGRTSW